MAASYILSEIRSLVLVSQLCHLLSAEIFLQGFQKSFVNGFIIIFFKLHNYIIKLIIIFHNNIFYNYTNKLIIKFLQEYFHSINYII